MPAQTYPMAMRIIMKKAKDGFRLSQVSGLERAVAERLIDRGTLIAIPLSGTRPVDWLVNKK